MTCSSVLPRLALGVLPATILMGGCALQDSHTAHEAETSLIGLTEPELESCLGVPDQHASFGAMDILTYYTTSTSSMSYSVPLVGGLGLSNGGYCHATFQVQDGRVRQILYSGEKNAALAPDAYCAPIVATCVAHMKKTASTQQQPPDTIAPH